MGGKSSAAYFQQYNAARNGKYYHEAKADPDKWQRVLDARARTAAKRRATTTSSPEAWVRNNVRQVAIRCRRDGHAFDLLPADIMVVSHCPITGAEINYASRGRDPNGPSFDRIRPALGYVKGNVRIVSRFANLVRQNCTSAKVFRALADDALRWFGDT